MMAIHNTLKKFDDEIQIKHFKKGEYLERFVNPIGSVFYIVDGRVIIETVSYRGKKLIVDELEPGNFCGQISGYRGKDVSFHCDLKAGKDSGIMMISLPTLDKLLEYPEFACKFYERTSYRLYVMCKKFMLEKLFDREEIFAYHVCKHAKNRAYHFKSMYAFCEKLSMTRRGLYNILNRLVRNNCLEKKGNTLIIQDQAYLEEKASRIREYYDEYQFVMSN